MIYQYSHSLPFIFGAGAVSLLGEKVKELGCKKVLCVSEKGIRDAGITDKAVDILRASGIECLIFDGVTSDPIHTDVDKGGEFARKEKIDAVIGIGGGSSLDSAKAIAVLMDNPPPLAQYLSMPPKMQHTSVPIILVPTTSGTGSEATDASVMSDTGSSAKRAVAVRSTLAIIDPELTCTVPKKITAYTGMDALSHAVEAATTNRTSPFTEVVACAAIERVCKYLPAAYENGFDIEARSNMSLAANWAGIAITDANIHFGHAMADALSATFPLNHGLTCALIIPATIRLVADALPDTVRMIGRAMGLEISGNASTESVVASIEATLHKLMRQLNIPSLKELGYSREETVASYVIAADNKLQFSCPAVITPEIARDMMAYVYDSYQ